MFVNADVLREDGSSLNGTGWNTANVADAVVWVGGTPHIVSHSEGPNTTYAIAPGVTVHLNEQGVSASFCPVFWGDALRLEITDPTTGALIAQVIVSWVSTSTC